MQITQMPAVTQMHLTASSPVIRPLPVVAKILLFNQGCRQHTTARSGGAVKCLAFKHRCHSFGEVVNIAVI